MSGGNLGDLVLGVRMDLAELQNQMRRLEQSMQNSGRDSANRFQQGFSGQLQGGGFLKGIATNMLQGIGMQMGMGLLAGIQKVLTAPITIPLNIAQDSFKGYQEFAGYVQQFKVYASASEKETKALSEEAKRLGAATSKTAGEVAQAATVMARLGFNADEAKESLTGVVALAEATGEEMETAGELIAQAGTIYHEFGRTAEGTTQLADMFTAVINASNLDIQKLSLGLATVGGVAKSMNQPLDDLVIILGLLSDTGLRAETAATGLKTALLQLANPDKKTQEGLEELASANNGFSLSLRDSEGNMRSILELLPELRAAFANLSPAQRDSIGEKLFGREGITAFNALIQTSVEKVEETTSRIKTAFGEAEKSKQALMQGLTGSLDVLDSSIDTLKINFAEAFAPAVEAAAKFGTALANELTNSKGLFTNVSQSAQEFTRFLEKNPQIVKETADVIDGVLKAGFKEARDLAYEFLTTLQENPGAIRESVEAVAELTQGLVGAIKAAAQLAGKFAEAANELRILNEGQQAQNADSSNGGFWEKAGNFLANRTGVGFFGNLLENMQYGPEIEGSRNTVYNNLGMEGGREFDKRLEEALKNKSENLKKLEETADKRIAELERQADEGQAQGINPVPILQERDRVVQQYEVDKAAIANPGAIARKIATDMLVDKAQQRDAPGAVSKEAAAISGQERAGEKPEKDKPNNSKPTSTITTESDSGEEIEADSEITTKPEDLLAQKRRMEDRAREAIRAEEDLALSLKLEQAPDVISRQMIEFEKGVLNQQRAIEDERTGLERAKEDLLSQSPQAGQTNWQYPVAGASVTSPFGADRGARGKHSGIDFAAPEGTAVVAVERGIVQQATYLNDIIGNVIKILHPDGTLSRYGHLKDISVQPGQEVSRGQPIGTVGSTGRSTGPHLHFEAYDKKGLVDPNLFLGKPQVSSQPQDLQLSPLDAEEISQIETMLADLAEKERKGLQIIETQRANFIKQESEQLGKGVEDLKNSLGINENNPIVRDYRQALNSIEIKFKDFQETAQEQIKNLESLKTAMEAQGASAESLEKINQALISANNSLTESEKAKQKAIQETTDAFNRQVEADKLQKQERILSRENAIASQDASILESRGDIFAAQGIRREVAIKNAESFRNQELNQALTQYNFDSNNPGFKQEEVLIMQQYSQQLGLINSQFSELSLLAQPIQSAFEGMFTGLFTGAQSFGEAIQGFFASIVQSIGQMAAQLASQKIMGLLFPSLFGGLTGGLSASAGVAVPMGHIGAFSEGGEVGKVREYPLAEALQREGNNAVLAALTPGEQVLPIDEAQVYRSKFPNGLLSDAQNFAPFKAFSLFQGGIVENDPSLSIKQALQREGKNAVLAALTPGEQVLPIDEARVYRSMFPNGLKVENYNSGGVVGGNHFSNNSRVNFVNPAQPTVNITVHARDADSFKRSQEQISRETALQYRRSMNRNT